jgi:hypothetical protein
VRTCGEGETVSEPATVRTCGEGETVSEPSTVRTCGEGETVSEGAWCNTRNGRGWGIFVVVWQHIKYRMRSSLVWLYVDITCCCGKLLRCVYCMCVGY